jgi:hypothetical protein
MGYNNQQFMQSLIDLKGPDRMAAVKGLSEDLGKELTVDEKNIVTSSFHLEPPEGKVRDIIWLIVICGFVFVLVLSFLAIAFTVIYFPKEESARQIILTIFTSAVGFLAGLMAPSPVSKSGNG